jgi:hypothetical protein
MKEDAAPFTATGTTSDSGVIDNDFGRLATSEAAGFGIESNFSGKFATKAAASFEGSSAIAASCTCTVAG